MFITLRREDKDACTDVTFTFLLLIISYNVEKWRVKNQLYYFRIDLIICPMTSMNPYKQEVLLLLL